LGLIAIQTTSPCYENTDPLTDTFGVVTLGADADRRGPSTAAALLDGSPLGAQQRCALFSCFIV
jgi:hypothetical protein